ncbi:MAG: hypothetical protein ACWA5L_09855 [bacterium]
MYGEAGKFVKITAALIALVLTVLFLLIPYPAMIELAKALMLLQIGAFFGFGCADGRVNVIATETLASIGIIVLVFWADTISYLVIPLAFFGLGLWALGHHRVRLQQFLSLAAPVWYLSFSAIISFILFGSSLFIIIGASQHG